MNLTPTEQSEVAPELSVADLGVGAYGVTATTSSTAGA